ncbi:hypothetical protein AFCDBAGC_3707 [Methylobacterium cerastii]|uniref:Uncharacterized protein n=1 Tax=Methylobacterium cerastii TaxID=932741 RepID=A0ABQ4QLN4_9HYPH|nr:hypothetical protein [Methylobacterium cerastii]GJD45830.1 hypothetical protein AFCDBAGC_3707 [Methylobacterium cerastii]
MRSRRLRGGPARDAPDRHLGVDPGLHGAWALLDGHGLLLVAGDFPIGADGEIDVVRLADTWRDLAPQAATVELVGQITRIKGRAMGISGRFNFGRRYGAVLAVLDLLAIPRDSVDPTLWKARTGVSADKKTSLNLVRRLWPAHAPTIFRLIKHEGRAEAALIGRYGLTHRNLRRRAY